MQSSAHSLLSKLAYLRLLIGLGAFIISALLLQPLMPLTAHADTPKQANFTIRYLDNATQQYVTKSLRLNASGGAKLQQSIAIMNTGNIAGTANLYAADALTNQNGGIAYQNHNSPPRNVATWITLSLNKVTLSPGQQKALTVQIAVPRGARPGMYVGGLVAEDASMQTVTRAGKNSKFSITILRRSVLSIRITVPGKQTENLLNTSMNFDNSSGLQAINLALNNLSTDIIEAKGTLLIADLKGRRIQLLPVQISGFLPQTSISYPVYLQGAGLKAGTYRATLDLKYGQNHPLHVQSNVTVVIKQVKSNMKTLAAFLGPDQDSGSGGGLLIWQIAGFGTLLLIGSGTICFWLFKFGLILKRRMGVGIRH
jgi:hypothetical protein